MGVELEVGPDLSRDAGDGTLIECYFVPSLANATHAVIQIVSEGGNLLLDEFEVSVEDAFETWKHAALSSDPYRQSLT